MAPVDRLVLMLRSGKSAARYEACEELRVASHITEAAIMALEKAAGDPDHTVADAAKNALGAHSHERELVRLGKPIPTTHDQPHGSEESRMLAAIIMVTTPTIEGRQVAEYLGIVTAEVVMGTGVLAELGAAFSDFFGARSMEFQGKLARAKDAAMSDLRRKTYELGGDAVLALDLDYSALGNNMLMVVASGTAIRLSSND